jgi:histidinol-phosphatase
VHSDPDDLTLALTLADVADEITLGRYGAADLRIDTKADLTPVTEADTAVERALRDSLAASRPNDSVLGEEFGDTGESPRRWILDPIDGTKNFVRGIPAWATLIALEEAGDVTLGVVSAPALRRRWWAARGQGAFVDDGLSAGPRQLHVSSVEDLADAQLCLSAAINWEAIGCLDGVLELERRCWRTRGFGDFWSYMLVAEGAAEIGGDPEASLWDLVSMQIVVEEAGGRFTDLTGVVRADGGNALATNGLLHEATLEILGA